MSQTPLMFIEDAFSRNTQAIISFKTDQSLLSRQSVPFSNRTNLDAARERYESQQTVDKSVKDQNSQQQLFTMKSNNTDGLDYSKSQTNRSQASSRYNFRQIMSPLPNECDHI